MVQSDTIALLTIRQTDGKVMFWLLTLYLSCALCKSCSRFTFVIKAVLLFYLGCGSNSLHAGDRDYRGVPDLIPTLGSAS